MKSILHFATKYISRSAHLATFAFILGNLTVDYMFGKRSETMNLETKKAYIGLHIASSVILIASGIINMILLYVENKFVKDIYYKIWKNILYIKFIGTLLLTPILEKVLPDSIDKEAKSQQIRVGIVIAMFLVSPFLRYFREKFLTPNKKSESKME